MYTIEEYPFRGLTIRIVPDDDAESPRTYDNLGHMVCWHSRYDLGDEQVRPNDHYSLDEFLTALVDDYSPTVVLPLYLLDHSGITIKAGERIDLAELFIPDREPFTFDPGGWDTSFVGFILDSTGSRINMGIKPGDIEEVLRWEVSAYANYLEGGYVGFVIEDADGNHLDSLWGIDDLKYAKECAEESANQLAQELAETAAADAKIRYLAAWEYADDDLMIDDDAPVEAVDGGYWVDARVWIDDAAVQSRQGESA